MPRRRKRIGVDVWVLWRDFKGAARAIFLGLMWNSWMTKTDDGVMMKKWCCTGLFLGEISEICWYMCIYIYTQILRNGLNSGDSSLSWYHRCCYLLLGYWRFNLSCPLWERQEAMEHQLEQQNAPEDQEAPTNAGKLPLAASGTWFLCSFLMKGSLTSVF